jgi:predicted O-methyltransferase YrrM
LGLDQQNAPCLKGEGRGNTVPDPAPTLRVSAQSWRETMSAVTLPRKKKRRFQRLWDKLRGKDRHKRLLKQAAERESELRDRIAERDWHIAERDWRIADLDCRLAQIDGHISPLAHHFRWDIPDPLPFDASLRCFYGNAPTLAELRQDDWLSSPTAKELSNYFSSYPPNSLVSPASRAVMYHLTAARRPLRALEIGTYKAGTSEVIVHAMNEANCGLLFTIDPFGADRVPLRIARWPRSLQRRLRFFATDSGICLGRAIEDGIQFDLIFIDGNHEFEFAYFDLAGSARVAGPDAIIVVDNISQPGPRRAVRKFLEDYPDWSRLTLSEPYPETEFSILCGPEDILVNDQPKSFGQRRYLQGNVRTVELDIAHAPRRAPARWKFTAEHSGPEIPRNS